LTGFIILSDFLHLSGSVSLSYERQQEEAKRPKSPETEDVQLAEQHGSGGEGGEEEERERIWSRRSAQY
jgi:hypothetical protein